MMYKLAKTCLYLSYHAMRCEGHLLKKLIFKTTATVIITLAAQHVRQCAYFNISDKI